MWQSDPVTIAAFIDKKRLHDEPIWKSLPQVKHYTKSAKKLTRMAKQAKLHLFRTKPVCMFGILIPRNHDQAMQFDKDNGNHLWRETEEKELAQVDEYDTFIDKGKGYHPGTGWKKI